MSRFNDAILNFIYKLEFIFKVLVMNIDIVIYVRRGRGLHVGDVLRFDDLEAKLRRKK